MNSLLETIAGWHLVVYLAILVNLLAAYLSIVSRRQWQRLYNHLQELEGLLDRRSRVLDERSTILNNWSEALQHRSEMIMEAHNKHPVRARLPLN